MTAQELAEQIKEEVRKGVVDGWIPVTIASFRDLHEHCDANQLGNADSVWAAFSSDRESGDKLVSEAWDIVDAWLKNGGLR